MVEINPMEENLGWINSSLNKKQYVWSKITPDKTQLKSTLIDLDIHNSKVFSSGKSLHIVFTDYVYILFQHKERM